MRPDSIHGGNLRKLAEASGLPEDKIIDFSANLNPLGFPEWLRPLLASKVSDLVNYPDNEYAELINILADKHGVSANQVVVGNGATELIFAAPKAGAYNRAVIAEPAYVDYRHAARMAGLEVVTFPLAENDSFALDIGSLGSTLTGGELVMLGNPNNPTGKVFPSHDLRALAKRKPETTFLIDESFAGFVEGFDSLTGDRPDNVIVVISMTKLYAVPGLRLGFAIANKNIAGAMRASLPPWSVNTFAQAFGARAQNDDHYLQKTRDAVKRWREELTAELRQIDGLTIFDSSANFMLGRVDRAGMDARKLAGEALKQGAAIRLCANFEGLDERYFRVAVRGQEENGKLIEALSKAMNAPVIKHKDKMRLKTPAIMFQGVSSDSGKSTIASAMCRVLKQDGYDVAPFKAQNMALNSYVTLDGKEIGRAQVTQAQACGLEPDTLMNPVLLKPNSDTGAQVIVLGEAIGSMNVQEYFDYKALQGFETVKEAYDALSSKHDVMVMEGAGSPAEVNLKDRDIVNMRMARHAGACALLVGDIDRGGVFGSFIGCVETMTEWERSIMSGFLINKFRGDASLLKDAIDYTCNFTGYSNYGVIPFAPDLGLPEEDRSFARNNSSAKKESTVDIAVVRLKHTSNFSDFDALAVEPDVTVRSAFKPEDLDGADAVIIPGSKNVISDLSDLAGNGLGDKLKEIARLGKAEIVGVCGGFQIIGSSIHDPDGVESGKGGAKGLGFIKLETTLAVEKTLKRVDGTHLGSGFALTGYEIHHGKTTFNNAEALVKRDDGEVIGAQSGDGLIWGTYLHGLFDKDEFRRWFVDRLRVRKGFKPKGRVVARYDIESALDRLADMFRANVDLDRIYELMKIK
ncbi:Cobyric acid synthase [hydrothermal vent metagenome]|uniref:threonine-phosphate decarboxylase n=1 Tax=hydrothermal vent metagenome TaxID=652676 RepID=A0A3B1BVS4_9ZZZZ